MLANAKRILVTGAAGFVGSTLLTRLQEDRREVRAAVRAQSSDISDVDTTTVGNIGPDTNWQRALHGVDCVIHLAARTHVLVDRCADPLAAYRRINVEATQHLAHQAALAGVRRFIFLSSIKVNGEVTTESAFTEDYPPQPQDAYGITKFEAEKALTRIGTETAMEIVVLRPPLVYGPGVKGNFLRLLQWVKRGLPLPLASVDNRRSMIYVGNLADVLVACIDASAAAGKTYLVSDGEDVSTRTLISKLAIAMGRSPRLLPCPVALLNLAGTVIGKRAITMRLTGSLLVNSSLLRRELGWQPRFSLDQGLTSTAQWYHRGQN